MFTSDLAGERPELERKEYWMGKISTEGIVLALIGAPVFVGIVRRNRLVRL